MSEIFAEAVLNYLTPITVVIAMFLPSLWVSGAVGMTVAMIGILAYTNVQPDSQVVAAWLIVQVCVALGANLMRRTAR